MYCKSAYTGSKKMKRCKIELLDCRTKNSDNRYVTLFLGWISIKYSIGPTTSRDFNTESRRRKQSQRSNFPCHSPGKLSARINLRELIGLPCSYSWWRHLSDPRLLTVLCLDCWVEIWDCNKKRRENRLENIYLLFERGLTISQICDQFISHKWKIYIRWEFRGKN